MCWIWSMPITTSTGMKIQAVLPLMLCFVSRFPNVPHFDILAGVPLEILALDHWVPGVVSRQEAPKFKNQQQFQEILTTTEVTAALYILRATKDRL